MNIQLKGTNGRFNHLTLYNKHFISLILLNPHKESAAAIVIFFTFQVVVSPQHKNKSEAACLITQTIHSRKEFEFRSLRSEHKLFCHVLALEKNTPLKPS